MQRLRPHQLDSAGATDGQTLVWSAAQNRWIPGTVVGVGGSPSTVQVPLTTVIGGEPVLVWDADNQLVLTEVPA